MDCILNIVVGQNNSFAGLQSIQSKSMIRFTHDSFINYAKSLKRVS